jgi:hypothetical protein
MINQSDHIPAYILQSYQDQELDQTSHQQVESHLGLCRGCREELSRLEDLIVKMDTLPALELGKDLSIVILNQLRTESKLSLGLTWTLVVEILGAGVVIGLLIPAIRAAVWLPLLLDTRNEILAAVNVFLAQLASSWLVWWAGLKLSLVQITRSFLTAGYVPGGEFSPWALVLAAGGIGLLINFFLLYSQPVRSRNRKTTN